MAEERQTLRDIFGYLDVSFLWHGVMPYNKPLWTKLVIISIFSCFCYLMTTVPIKIFTDYLEGHFDLVYCLNIWLHWWTCIKIFVKIGNLYINEDLMSCFIEALCNDFWLHDDRKFRKETIKKTKKEAFFVFRYFLYMCLVALVLFWSHHISKFMDKYQIRHTYNDTKWRHLPIRSNYYVFEETEMPFYGIILFAFLLFSFYILTSVYTCDCFGIGTLIHLTGHLKDACDAFAFSRHYVKRRILLKDGYTKEKLLFKYGDKDEIPIEYFKQDHIKENTEMTERINRCMLFYLKRYIKHHFVLIKYAELYEKLFMFDLLCQICVTCALFLIALLAVLVVDEPLNISNAKFWIVPFFITIVLDFYPFCYYGQLVRDNSMEISQAAYNSEWYMMPQDIKRCFLLIMIRAQKPLVISMGKLADLNIASFADMASAAYRVVAMIRQMMDM